MDDHSTALIRLLPLVAGPARLAAPRRIAFDLPAAANAPGAPVPRGAEIAVADPTLAEVKECIRRTLQALDVLGRVMSRGLVLGGGAADTAEGEEAGDDPRFAPAPRDIARLVWLMGHPDADPLGDSDGAAAVSDARIAAGRLRGWLSGAAADLVLPPVLAPAPARASARAPARPSREGAVAPLEGFDRLEAFALETALDHAEELSAMLRLLESRTGPAPRPARPR